MILSRFLKPKWQHTDSATRQKALRELDQADPKLIELARQDLEPSVRRAALERLVDLDVLQGSIDTDTDEGVRTTARSRHWDLLAGKIDNGPPLAERLERFRRDPNPELRDFLLQQAAEPELRLAALERIDLEATLVEITLQNPHQDLRMAALELSLIHISSLAYFGRVRQELKQKANLQIFMIVPETNHTYFQHID